MAQLGIRHIDVLALQRRVFMFAGYIVGYFPATYPILPTTGGLPPTKRATKWLVNRVEDYSNSMGMEPSR